ncbi:uncharacterized protein LOC106638621 [Copidosoma floridanum]|uniref:uncharacterized protein LOC106638621 n=1 Tax=Copidosoma floridanum TaxID=29053 RepID=UPI0006C9C3E3|nr:uncharacterized protein LOC106638621 [Copidosoma floridanum]
MSVGSGIRRLEAWIGPEPGVLGATAAATGIPGISSAPEEDEQQHQLGNFGMSSSGSSASIARFPKLDECAHFHYEHVELGRLEVSLSESEQSSSNFAVRVTSGDACWTLQRSFDNLVLFDRQLHRCIFDRSYSQLAELSSLAAGTGESQLVAIASEYLRRFSSLSHEGLNCGPVLNWMQLDNRGRRILVPEADSCPINMPAVAAAYAVRPHRAQATDEISFQVGDMISVIDMPPAGESSWWRGKRGFDVGFFPAECVALIGDKLPRHLAPPAVSINSNGGQHPLQQLHQQQPVKPVLRKHGKLIAFFRSFILNRPSRRRLKQSGILRERVFGCDLGEHLLNSGREVPSVLSCCANFIERNGLVDGIYRLSGVTSNIQRLRHAFDEDRLPVLHADESILQDIHSVASLLKMYFRELPNPLCTYQLYSTFVSAVQSPSDAERLARMRDAVRKLPPPHYRTLEYLMRHLVRVAARGDETGMTPRNVAIVWAPNLLRCKELEVGGVAALQGVGVQAVVTEFLICYAELIFAPGPSGVPLAPTEQRPKSLAIASNTTRLLTLEEARSRSLAPEPELIEVGPGAAGLPARYHTIIDLPPGQRKRTGSKRSPSLNWRALFGRAAAPARQSMKKDSKRAENPAQGKSVSAPVPMTRTPISYSVCSSSGSSSAGANAPQIERRPLRPVKSADSLDGATEDSLGPLLTPAPTASVARTCGHSRSVSHDSYFEQLADATSSAPSAAASALDLSEIQLSFELEEREMRMLSGEESLEVSPRRLHSKQEATDSVNGVNAGGSSSSSNSSGRSGNDSVACVVGPGGSSTLMPVGGSKRKRSRLEERLQCEVELRFIDSQSPDQIMVSADVHEIDTPSPLPTPGYLPLLSEASTPLTPNASPAAISPRISFKSFSLPLEVDEAPTLSPLLAISPAKDSSDKVGLLQSYLTKAPRDHRVCTRLDFGSYSKNLENNHNSAMEACEEVLTNGTTAAPAREPQRTSSSADFFDQEMALCDRLHEPSSIEMAPQTSRDISLVFSNTHRDMEQNKSTDDQVNADVDKTVNEKCEDQNDKARNTHTLNSNSSEHDSPMICEQSYVTMLHTNIISDDISTKNRPSIDQIEETQKFSSDFEEANKWLMTSTPPILASLSSQKTTNDETQEKKCLEKSLDSEHYLVNTPIEVQINQEPMYCSSSDKAHLETNTQTDNTNFHSSSVNQPKLASVSLLETNLLLMSNSLEANSSNSNIEISRTDYQVSDNVKNSVYQNEKRESQIPLWKSVITDDNQCDTSELEKEASNASNDETGDSFNKKISETKVIDEQCSLVESQAYVDPKESEFVRSDEPLEQVTNSFTTSGASNNYSSEKYPTKQYVGQECSESLVDSYTRDDLGVVVPLESAAVEPQEMAHVPDVISDDAIRLRAKILPSSDKRVERNTVLQKDTAAILQELALQRLSGGIGGRMDSTSPRRRLDSDYLRDRRSFDSEIGREIVREHKMKQELENARGKLDESHKSNNHNQTPVPALHQLPPCLRARHARTTRAALSRSLDEAKFNKMTSNSEPMTNEASASSEKLWARSGYVPKNLGIDLDDPQCRERIEKYKEERRTFLRDKYRSESFRAAASSATSIDKQALAVATSKEDEEQALLARLKQRASKPSLL